MQIKESDGGAHPLGSADQIVSYALESCYLLGGVLAQPQEACSKASLAAVSLGISAARTIGSTNSLVDRV